MDKGEEGCPGPTRGYKKELSVMYVRATGYSYNNSLSRTIKVSAHSSSGLLIAFLRL